MSEQQSAARVSGECAVASEFGMEMARSFSAKNGRVLPRDDVEFAGMLAIAFMLGRESVSEK